jgi:hypothetical protein
VTGEQRLAIDDLGVGAEDILDLTGLLYYRVPVTLA